MVRISVENGIASAVLERPAGGVSLHSRRDPVAEAGRLLVGIGDERDHLVIIGPGLGYVLDALERCNWPGTVLAFEILPELAQAFAQREIAARWRAEGRLRVFTAPAFDGAQDAWRLLDRRETAPPIIEHPVLLRERPADMAAARDRAARVWFDARANADARRTQAWPYLRNTLLNTRRITRAAPSDVLDGTFTDVPAIIVGAGPSLDGHLDALRDVRHRALVIAVDTATRPLLAAGIEPHLIVALDPTDVNARHLTHLPPHDAYLVAEGSVDPHAMRAHETRLFVFNVADHEPWPWLTSIGARPGRLRAWGSVLTAATDLALRAGCPRLVFVGADLSYPGGQPYCRGTAFEEDWSRMAVRGQSLQDLWANALRARPEVVEADVAGHPVRTASHLIAFRDWIVRQSDEFGDRQFVNASGAGILHGGRFVQSALRAALADVGATPALGERIARTHRAHVTVGDIDPLPPPAYEVWQHFAGNAATREAIDAALIAAEDRPLPRRGTTDPMERRLDEAGVDGGLLSHAELRLLRSWAGTQPTRFVALPSPAEDRAHAISTAVASLAPGDFLVLVDPDGTDAGSLTRQRLTAHVTAGDCWFDDGRFQDWGCRLFAVARHAPPDALDGRAAEFDKYGDAHRALAEQVVAQARSWFTGDRVVDIGCGEGHWLRALRATGARDVRGVRVNHDAPPAAPDVAHLVTPLDPAHILEADVALLLHLVDRVDAGEAHVLIDYATAVADTVVFAAIPPGCGVSSPPRAMAMADWARAFAERGFMMDDSWRGRLLTTSGTAPSWYHAFVVFRRAWHRSDRPPSHEWVNVAAGLAGAADDAFLHAVRLHIRAAARSVLQRGALVAVRSDEIRQGPSGLFVVELRGDHRDRVVRSVREDGRPIFDWSCEDGLVSFQVGDGTNARFNGREYAVEVALG